MKRIYIDTNVFFKHGYFWSDQQNALFTACRLAGFEIVISETVMDEVLANYGKEINKTVNQLTRAHRKLSQLSAHEAVSFETDAVIAAYSLRLNQILNTPGFRKLDYLDVNPKELVQSSYSGLKPFDSNGNGFKDYLIWGAIREDMLSAQVESEFIFITDNTNDFRNTGTTTTSAGRFQIHSDLAAELGDLNGTLICYDLLSNALASTILPNLNGLTLDNVTGINTQLEPFVESMFEEHLAGAVIYGIEGLPFADDVTITMYGGPDNLNISIYESEGEHVVRITGSTECLFDGFIDKGEYFSEYSDALPGGEMWNDHVVNVDAEADLHFEILASYDPETGEFSGQNFEITNQVDPGWYN